MTDQDCELEQLRGHAAHLEQLVGPARQPRPPPPHHAQLTQGHFRSYEDDIC